MNKKEITDLIQWLEIESVDTMIQIKFNNKSVIAEKYLQHLKKKHDHGFPSNPAGSITENTDNDLPF